MGCTSVRNTSSPNIPYNHDRYLIITDDDFGASKNINEGIEIAARKNVITSISALTNFSESLSDLKRLAKNHPKIGIGIHLNITTGRPLLPPDQIPTLVNPSGNFYPLAELLCRLKDISHDDIRKELRAQIIAYQELDIRLDHLSDQHGIMVLYNPFFDIVTELAAELNVPIRSPMLAGSKYPEIFSNSQMNKRKRQAAFQLATSHPYKALCLLKNTRINTVQCKKDRLYDLGIVHPDLFITSFWGEPTIENFSHIIEHLPKGVSEVVVHIGTDTRELAYPSGLEAGYFTTRELELSTISSDYIREYMNYLNIETINYSEIAEIGQNETRINLAYIKEKD